MEGLTFVLGVLLLTLVFWDLFQTVVVPRPTPGWFRIGRYLVRGSWRLLRAVPMDLGACLYFAATSVLTLGFGDIVAEGGAARVIVTIAAISGLGVVALVVTFLFSLYGSYQRREARVVVLQAAAGAPPSAVALLESYAMLDLVGR